MHARKLAFRSGDLTFEGELVTPDDPRAVVVLCHGTPSGSPPEPDDPGYAGLARDLAARGHAALWFNFRGAKGAPGEFSLGGWCEDLGSALDALRLRPELEGLPRVACGSSMGGMVALAVGARRPDVAAVATLACPASLTFGGLLPDAKEFLHEARNRGMIVDPAFPVDPEAWAAEFGDLSAERQVPALSPRPVLLIHGESDQAVPYQHAERLFLLAGEPKELVRIPDGGHQLRRDARAVDAIVDWLDRRRAGMSGSSRSTATQRSQGFGS